MDRDYTIIALLILISAIAILVAKVYWGNAAAGLATVAATIFVVGKCLIALRSTTKQERKNLTRKNSSEDTSFAPIGKMSKFP